MSTTGQTISSLPRLLKLGKYFRIDPSLVYAYDKQEILPTETTQAAYGFVFYLRGLPNLDVPMESRQVYLDMSNYLDELFCVKTETPGSVAPRGLPNR